MPVQPGETSQDADRGGLVGREEVSKRKRLARVDASQGGQGRDYRRKPVLHQEGRTTSSCRRAESSTAKNRFTGVRGEEGRERTM